MKLMTKQIEKRAQAQYEKGNDLSQDVVAKFFDPTGSWTWYLMNQDPQGPLRSRDRAGSLLQPQVGKRGVAVPD